MVNLFFERQDSVERYHVQLKATFQKHDLYVVNREGTGLEALVAEEFDCLERHQRRLKRSRIHDHRSNQVS